MGCRYFEMGESGGVASLERVKSRFGGTPHYLVEYRGRQLPAVWSDSLIGRLRRADASDSKQSTAARECR